MMNELTVSGDKRMTLKEVAEITGAAYSTIAAYAQKAGWTENGKQTLLDERQTTILLEALKQGNNNQYNLPSSLEGIETSQSRVLQLQILQKQMQDIYEAEITELKAKTEADQPKVEFFDQVANSRDALQMRDVAGVLNLPGYGRNTLFEFLRKQGVLDGRNVPYRKYQDQGYFRVIEQKWTDNEGETHISLKTLVYQRGVDFIRRLIQDSMSYLLFFLAFAGSAAFFITKCSIHTRIHALFFQAFLRSGLLSAGFQGAGKPGMTSQVFGRYWFGFALRAVPEGVGIMRYGLQQIPENLFYRREAEFHSPEKYRLQGSLQELPLPLRGLPHA
jgi:phage antirepressor YoqD-like protein